MPVTCLCDSTFATRAILSEHVNTSGHTFKCACGRFFQDFDSACQHKHPHQYQFIISELVLTSDDAERPHATALHANEVQPEQNLHYICRICTKPSASKGRLVMHIADTHIICRACKKPFLNEGRLLMHIADTHKICPVCHDFFVTGAWLHEHRTTAGHYAEPETQPECCGCDFADAREFFRHLAVHQSASRQMLHSDLPCPLSTGCNGTYDSLGGLIRHIECGLCQTGMNHRILNGSHHTHDTSSDVHPPSDASSLIGTVQIPSLTITQANAVPIQAHDTSAENVASPVIDASSEVLFDGPAVFGIGGVVRSLGSRTVFGSYVAPAGNIVLVEAPSTQPMPDLELAHRDRHALTPTTGPIVDSVSFDTTAKEWGCRRCLKRTTLNGVADHIVDGPCFPEGQGRQVLKTIAAIYETKIKAATGKVVSLLGATLDTQAQG